MARHALVVIGLAAVAAACAGRAEETGTLDSRAPATSGPQPAPGFPASSDPSPAGPGVGPPTAVGDPAAGGANAGSTPGGGAVAGPPGGSPSPTVAAGTPVGGSVTVTTAAQGSAGGRFGLLGVGAVLPSGRECAGRVRAVPENVPENATYNSTRGRAVSGTVLGDAGSVAPNDFERRVDGDFVGSTDEIIQWAACKWGFDEDTVRAQAYAESSWYAGRLGDCDRVATQTSTDGCASVGLLQVQAAALYSPAHRNVLPWVQTSTAMNVDYALAVMRLCYEGKELWLGETSSGYAAGDLSGCLGRWFSGSFRDRRGLDYAAEVERVRKERPWEGTFVGCPSWASNRHCSR